MSCLTVEIPPYNLLAVICYIGPKFRNGSVIHPLITKKVSHQILILRPYTVGIQENGYGNIHRQHDNNVRWNV